MVSKDLYAPILLQVGQFKIVDPVQSLRRLGSPNKRGIFCFRLHSLKASVGRDLVDLTSRVGKALQGPRQPYFLVNPKQFRSKLFRTRPGEKSVDVIFVSFRISRDPLHPETGSNGHMQRASNCSFAC